MCDRLIIDVLGADGRWHQRHRLEVVPGEWVRVRSTDTAGVFVGVSVDGVTHIDYSGSGVSVYASMMALAAQRQAVREECGAMRGVAA